jgi:oligopeptide transport system substrate-binding protein
LERPLPWLPALLADQEGTPLPRKVIERHGNQWTRPGVMVSNGAFRLEDRKPRGNIRLAKNPRYHDASRVKLTAVVYVPGDDTLSLVNRFRAGEIQVNGWPGFAPRQQLALQRELGAAARVHPLISVRYLRFNVRRKPFDDPRIRAALSLAVDRERLIAKVLPGGEQPSVRAVPQGLPDDRWSGVNVLSANDYTARLARARALLAAAGWGKTAPRALELRVPSGNGEDLCTAVAAMWTAAGVPTRVVRSEIKSLIADLRRGDFDIALTGAQDTPSVEAYLERFRAGSTYNTGGYSNSAFERAFDAAQLLAQPEQRGPAIAAVEAQLNQDHAIVPLLQEVARNLVAPQVRGWVDNAYDVHLSRYLYLQQK